MNDHLLPDARQPEGAKAGKDIWGLNRELTEARIESAGLTGELQDARVLLAENNVRTATTFSALKDLKEEFDELKAELAGREAELSAVNAEMVRLNAEALKVKRRNLELEGKLSRELALREKISSLLRNSPLTDDAADQKEEVLCMSRNEGSAVPAGHHGEVRAPSSTVRSF